jgi:hypothetical protein
MFPPALAAALPEVGCIAAVGVEVDVAAAEDWPVLLLLPLLPAEAATPFTAALATKALNSAFGTETRCCISSEERVEKDTERPAKRPALARASSSAGVETSVRRGISKQRRGPMRVRPA